MIIDATGLDHKTLNERLREADDVHIINCCGLRYIGCASRNATITVDDLAGNAVGAYLDGGTIIVNANVQDAAADTMNNGKLIVHGNAGDAVGYAMRGGQIYIKGNAGYRTGIHMKEYGEQLPIIVIGGQTGSFLGEYQAGGIIIVLGIGSDECPVGDFCAAGMHGGRIYIRGKLPDVIPPQAIARAATDEDMLRIAPYIHSFCEYFGNDENALLASDYYVLAPNSENPYKQLYVRE